MGGAALTLRTESSLPLVTGEIAVIAVRENWRFWLGKPVTVTLVPEMQKPAE